MKRRFILKTNLTFWVIVVAALTFATVYQALALNRDISRIPASIRIKIPSIILIGGLAQIFLMGYLNRIRKVLDESDESLSQNSKNTAALTVQKNISGIRTVFILVNSLGFFLGPSVTFVIYYFAGRGYPAGEMFYIIAVHVLTGTAASLLQIAIVRTIFFEILSSFHIYENRPEFKSMKARIKKLLTYTGLSFLILLLISGQLYGYFAQISSGLLKPEDFTGSMLIRSFIESLVYISLILIVFYLLNKEEQSKLEQLQSSLNENLNRKDEGFSKIDIISFDEYGDLATSINAYTGRLESLVKNVAAAGKTVTRTSAELENSIKDSESALSKTQDVNKEIVNEITREQNAMEKATASHAKISLSINRVGESASRQSGIVNESSAAITEMSANIRSVAQLSDKASEETRSLNRMIQNGSGKLKETMKSIMNLKEASDQVYSIVSAIQSISDQTNLLAMNAAIEAAHAGKAGAGFSVVAGEVRKLAEESLKSARQIGDIINEMTQAISAGVDTAGETEEAFKLITESVGNTSNIIEEVSSSMEEQQRAAEDVNNAMNTLVDVSTILKRESDEQESFNKEMKESFNSLLRSIENLASRSEILSDLDRILSARISGLGSVNDANIQAVRSLEDAVNK